MMILIVHVISCGMKSGGRGELTSEDSVNWVRVRVIWVKVRVRVRVRVKVRD